MIDGAGLDWTGWAWAAKGPGLPLGSRDNGGNEGATKAAALDAAFFFFLFSPRDTVGLTTTGTSDAGGKDARVRGAGRGSGSGSDRRDSSANENFFKGIGFNNTTRDW